MYYLNGMPKKYYSVEIHQRYVGEVKPFWTQKEYEYQDLILNGFKVLRELNGYVKGVFPKARVDIYYDGPNGLGQKRIIGIETKVYKEVNLLFLINYGQKQNMKVLLFTMIQWLDKIFLMVQFHLGIVIKKIG